jgi:putative membrane protein
VQQSINVFYVVNALVFSVVGLIILMFSFIAFDKFTPGNLWQEIVEKHNVALSIVVGAMTIAISQIIAAAIHG